MVALIVNVVAAEQHAGFVAVDNLVEPSCWLGGGGIAKVLDVDVAVSAPSVDVVSSMCG